MAMKKRKSKADLEAEILNLKSVITELDEKDVERVYQIIMLKSALKHSNKSVERLGDTNDKLNREAKIMLYDLKDRAHSITVLDAEVIRLNEYAWDFRESLDNQTLVINNNEQIHRELETRYRQVNSERLLERRELSQLKNAVDFLRKTVRLVKDKDPVYTLLVANMVVSNPAAIPEVNEENVEDVENLVPNTAHVLELANNNKTIQAIKYWREITQCGLMDAKKAVETLMANNR